MRPPCWPTGPAAVPPPCPPARRCTWPPWAAPDASAATAEIGPLEPGKLADVALWRLDTDAHAGIADPVAALVLGSLPPLELLLLVGRRPVVESGRLATIDQESVARLAGEASRSLARRWNGG